MAIKTFTTGEVLTASDTNTFLANAGLVYVTSTTVGSAVSSVTVSNCFSSTYDNYQIVYSGIVATASTTFTLKLGSTTTGYYFNLLYSIYGGATSAGLVQQNQAAFTYSGVVAPNGSGGTMDLYAPFLATRTGVRATYLEYVTAGATGQFTGFLDNATSYTGFTLTPTGQTITGGTITVYGYRKA